MEKEKYRPYKNGEELLKDYEKHHGMLFFVMNERPHFITIVGFTDGGIKLANGDIWSYSEIFRNLVWADDKSPCGVKVEENKSKEAEKNKYRPYKERLEFLLDVEKHGTKLLYKGMDRDFSIMSFNFINKELKVMDICQPFTFYQLFEHCLWADDHSPMGVRI